LEEKCEREDGREIKEEELLAISILARTYVHGLYKSLGILGRK
jgi:hypothetical protein